MKTCISIIVIILFTEFNLMYSQELDSLRNEYRINTRSFFIGLGLGYPEFVGLRIGHQYDPDLSIALAAGPNGNSFLGRGNVGIMIVEIKVTKFFNDIFLGLNNVCLSIGHAIPLKSEGYLVDISIGSESKGNKLFNVYWSVGGALLLVESIKPYLTPSIKLGLNFNF